MKETKSYKLPERYSLEIVDYCLLKHSYGSFRIKDLQRNVISCNFLEKSLSKLDKIIYDYERNLTILQGIENLNNNPDVDVILKPGSKHQLFYKGKELGFFETLVEVIDSMNQIEAFEYKVNALNNHEDVRVTL